ncbi:magnesium protoporphyrin IX methyltransferase [uncultured Nevskia sp.]|uniref:magnesium protoporphyrin IX methyltransferase n=1 Tax=uncultured Nevskia sp. TaxID=228950 RepID=UPI0025CD21EE|nr:magnesium protoporphyrin IX methyltransferase [uncultured Nevskia sp.]
MSNASYAARRGQLETYFDRTAAETWARLTSTAKVSRIRETVRAGRDEMRATLLSWLPEDLSGRRILDAGCGTGALAIEAARRGAEVIAIDIAGNLVNVARERAPSDLKGSIEFHVGDMLNPALGSFDHVVAMDSLIHYQPADIADTVAKLMARTRQSIVITFAPKTPLLTVMHNVGLLFPRGDRAPAIVPVTATTLRDLLEDRFEAASWTNTRTQRVASGFYKSEAFELKRA